MWMERALAGLSRTWTPPTAPRGRNHAPPVFDEPLPLTQNEVPSLEVAALTLLVLKAASKRVDVSTVPAASMRPTMRLATIEAVPFTEATPGAAS
jgi:hypothetical protein